MADPKRKSFPLPIGANLVDITKPKAAKPMSQEEVRKRLQAHESLRVDVGPSATKGMTLDHNFDFSPEQVKVMDILFYDGNPRSVPNPIFAEIKESIRETGLHFPLMVTRRPGSKSYMLCNGGNTRLKAIQELWQETNDPKFEIVECIFRTWKSESHVLAGHLVENEARAEMTLWDKAKGLISLKDKLEAEEEALLSMRDMEDRLRKMGVPANKSAIALYSFVTERLSAVGPKLSYRDAQLFQKKFSFNRKLAAKLGLPEDDFWALVQTTLEGFESGGSVQSARPSEDAEAVHFNVPLHVAACEEAIASKLGRTIAEYRLLLDAQERAPNATLPELQEMVATKPADPIQSAPNAASTGIPASALAPSARAGAAMAPEGASEASVASSEGDEPQAETHAVMPGSGAISGHSGSVAPKLPPVSLEAQISSKRKAVTMAAEQLARAGAVMPCFRHSSAMPLGFYMEFPPESIEFPTEAEPHTMRPTVWWFLATLSGQREHDVIKQCMPETSSWRVSYEAKPPLEMAEQEIRINQLLGPSSDYMDMRWAFAPLNPVCRQMADLMTTHLDLVMLEQKSHALLEGGEE